ncbi:Homeodomain-like DNA binding domain-containing transcription factor, partial [Phycomyces blakesleeanus NRRL 1555(-)]
MSPISRDKILSIEVELRHGKSIAEVAKIVGVLQTSVKRYQRKLNISTSVPGGRPAQINERLAHHIIYAFLNEEFMTTTEAERQLCDEGFAVKAPAIHTLLKASGFICTLESPPK